MDKQELTNEALQQLLDWAQRGDAFVTEQAPLVAQEIVTWGIVSGMLQAAFCIAIITIYVMSLFVISRATIRGQIDWDTPNAKSFPSFLVILLGFAPTVFAVLEGWVSLTQAAQAYFAPRLYVLEQVTQMVGGG